MSDVLNFIVSFVITSIMGFLCSFLFLWANIEEARILQIIPETNKEDK